MALPQKRSGNPPLRAFGAWLESKRNAAKKTREQISIKLGDLGVPLGGSTLAQYEHGRVWAPDPGVLWGLARIYNSSLDEVVALLRANRQRPDASADDWPALLRQAQDLGAPNPAHERIRELEDTVKLYETFLREARKLTEHLHAFASAGPEMPVPVSDRRTRRR